MRAAWCHCLLALATATPTPPPGPKCKNGKGSNESGLVPQCDENGFIDHDASCGPSGLPEEWVLRAKFHVGDKCHGENDPNGMMYHNGVYHFFFQDHVTGGTVGGHMASKDFVHWRRLPVALWNDKWYDKAGVWTFSATVVNGAPVMVYPGIAQPNQSLGDCGSMCFTHAVALPADLSDPWLMDWVKPDFNPIRMGTQRDPSTAWRTKAGEWRYTAITKEIFSSWDFESWELVGKLDSFGSGECPDFFELPPLCNDCTEGADEGSFQPTHVHANVHYELGIYDDGPANSTGNWTVIPGWSPKDTLMDGHDTSANRLFYASKSFWDPAKNRRILWGWVRLFSWFDDAKGFKAGQCAGLGGKVMTNTNSLPRVISYDPLLQKLLFFPVEEMVDLRDTELLNMESRQVSNRIPLEIPDDAVRQSEVRISFDMPSKATRLGVSVMTGIDESGAAFGTEFFVDFEPNRENASSWAVQAGHDSSSMLCPDKKANTGYSPCPMATLPLYLKKSDRTIDIAVWVDNLVVEAYFMGGRSPWTVALPCPALVSGARGASVFADGPATKLRSAQVWSVKDLSYEDVEQTTPSLAV